MTTPLTTQLIVEEHRTELLRSAATARLAAIARCCRPSTWARAARRAGEIVSRARAALRLGGADAAVCCAGA